MPVGFCVTVNGRWLMYRDAPHLWGSFLDWDLQGELLQYFAIGSIEVDPYDGAVFEGQQLDVLVKQLETAVTDIRSRPPEWPVLEDRLQFYYDGGKAYAIDLLPPRDQSIAILERAIELARQARNTNEKLQFVGD